MFAARYFNPRYWAKRYWAKVGSTSSPDCFVGFQGKITPEAAFQGEIELNVAVEGFINDDAIGLIGIIYPAARYEGFIDSSDTLSQDCEQDKKDYGGVADAATIFIDYGLITEAVTEFIDYGDLTGNCILIDSIGFFGQSNIKDKEGFIGPICN